MNIRSKLNQSTQSTTGEVADLTFEQIDQLLVDPELRVKKNDDSVVNAVNEALSSRDDASEEPIEDDPHMGLSRLVEFIRSQKKGHGSLSKKDKALKMYIDQSSPSAEETEKGLQLKKTA